MKPLSIVFSDEMDSVAQVQSVLGQRKLAEYCINKDL